MIDAPHLRRLSPAAREAVLTLAALQMKEGKRLDEVAQATIEPWKPRPTQVPPPGDWRWWLIMAGRRFGKTRTGAETISQWVREGKARRIALVAKSAADVRDTVVEGEAGLLAVSRPGERPTYEPSKRRVTWPNGAVATTYSAEEPDSLRGPGFDTAWCDELAAWKYFETWDLLQPALSFGWARGIVTTTPRPVRVITQLLADPRAVVSRGRTLDNAANLSPDALSDLIRRYAGTRYGRQELDAEVLEDVEGALWTRGMFDERRPAPDMSRIVVAIDPAATSGENADETGIIVAGKGVDGRGYVLADRSCRMSPDGWARRALAAWEEFEADGIIAEDNNGGEMVEFVIRKTAETNPAWRGATVRRIHASRGKRTRAEPVSALYEQDRVTHVEQFDELEEQLCSWTPDSGDSPDRLDALVWGLTELLVDDGESGWLGYMRDKAAGILAQALPADTPTCDLQYRASGGGIDVCARPRGHIANGIPHGGPLS